MFPSTIFLFIECLGAGVPMHAYIGPGASAGTIALVLGVLGSIILAIFSLLWYPIKRMLRSRRTNAAAKHDPAQVGDE